MLKYALLTILGLSAAADEYYNILSIDGGGIKGIIPATCLEKVEKYAYDYATQQGYDFPKYWNYSDGGKQI